MDEDADDIQEALSGDEDAFARLVDRHGSAVNRRMRHFSRDPGECEELAQEVFVEAYLSLRGFKGTAPFGHWLAKISSRVGFKFWKDRDRRKKTFPLDENLEKPVSENPDPSEAADFLHALLAELPDKDRLVLTLMYFEECTVEEIAGRMGWSKVLVGVRAHRARKSLRRIAEMEPWRRRLSCLTF